MTNHVFARESFRNALAFITAVSRVILYFLDGETHACTVCLVFLLSLHFLPWNAYFGAASLLFHLISQELDACFQAKSCPRATLADAGLMVALIGVPIKSVEMLKHAGSRRPLSPKHTPTCTSRVHCLMHSVTSLTPRPMSHHRLTDTLTHSLHTNNINTCIVLPL